MLFITTNLRFNTLRCAFDHLTILNWGTSSPHLLLFLEFRNAAVYELLNSPSHHTLPNLSVRDLHFSPGTTKSIYTGKLLRCTFHCSIPWLKQSFTSLIHLHWNCTSTATWLIDLLFPKTKRTVFFLCCSYFLQWKTQKSLIEKKKKQAHVSVDRRKSHFRQPGNGCVMPFSRK